MAGQAAPPVLGRRDDLERFHRFASTTVHHLREPVRMIGIYSDMMHAAVRSGSAEHAAQSIESIGESAQQLQRLLDGLGEFAAVTSGESRPRSTVPLDLALRHALLDVDGELKESHAQIISSQLPDVEGDFDHLQLVFRHLIRNAVRYRGGPAPEIGITATDANGEWIVDVRDNGPGIDPEYREKVFELYTRLHRRDRPGNGLGLSVCRLIVENHGGRIWIEGNRPSGTAVRFTLPG